MDANVLIAALLRDSTTRRLVLLGGHELHAPDYLFGEIETHRRELTSRSGLAAPAFREAMDLLRRHVVEHEAAEYMDRLPDALVLLKDRDVRDAPYVALTLALEADGLWSEDRGLVSMPGVQVVRTNDLVGTSS